MLTPKRRLTKQRPTPTQVAHNLDIFRPTPTITATATQIKLTPSRGNLRGFVDVELAVLDEPFLLLRGVRIVQQDGQRPWIQMPVLRSEANGKYYAIARSLNERMFERLKASALEAYSDALGGAA